MHEQKESAAAMSEVKVKAEGGDGGKDRAGQQVSLTPIIGSRTPPKTLGSDSTR
jgi:hypothetical protein